MRLVVTRGTDLAILASATAAGQALGGSKAHLYVNNFQPTPGADVAAFEEATYAGYAPQPITWLAPTISDAGQVELIGTSPEFRPTDDTIPNSVYGIFVTNSAGDKLLLSARFDNPPAPMGGVMDNILVTLRYQAPGGGEGVLVS